MVGTPPDRTVVQRGRAGEDEAVTWCRRRDRPSIRAGIPYGGLDQPPTESGQILTNMGPILGLAHP
ncbi:hypothetical protein HPP92_012856 [Vanilla planifolia]|uniref:Uncharacterized protein n=1 Tax=Vanilla planifolia TaxID=51239 RepID=A0A835QMB5_VANPL|nr:hypothetical protein HPP92_012856 [Vanilla planifolia]